MVREQPEAVSTYAGHRQRLRDRFRKSGLEGFADYEIVELLLTLAIPRSDVKQPAKELIRRFGDLRGILDTPSADLRTVPGIGKVAPVALKIVKAAATLYLQQESEAGEFLADPSRLENFWRMRLGALTIPWVPVTASCTVPPPSEAAGFSWHHRLRVSPISATLHLDHACRRTRRGIAPRANHEGIACHRRNLDICRDPRFPATMKADHDELRQIPAGSDVVARSARTLSLAGRVVAGDYAASGHGADDC